jgi:hypothetical protein
MREEHDDAPETLRRALLFQSSSSSPASLPFFSRRPRAYRRVRAPQCQTGRPSHAHKLTLSCPHAPSHSDALKLTHSRPHAQTLTLTLTHASSRSDAQALRRSDAQTLRRSRTQAHALMPSSCSLTLTLRHSRSQAPHALMLPHALTPSSRSLKPTLTLRRSHAHAFTLRRLDAHA